MLNSAHFVETADNDVLEHDVQVLDADLEAVELVEPLGGLDVQDLVLVTAPQFVQILPEGDLDLLQNVHKFLASAAS